MRSERLKPRIALPAAVAALVLISLAAATVTRRARADDGGWPREFQSSVGAFVIYQPQPEDLSGDQLSSRAAFSLQKSGEATPMFGVLWFTERIAIDRDSSSVSARAFDVTKVRLPGITSDEASRYEHTIESEAAGWDLSGSLAELQAGLASTEKERASVANLNNDPPKIVFSYQRAILLAYDGAPMLEPIEGTNLERVANTAYAVVHDPSHSAYFLNGANLWYMASDPLGPWKPIASPPEAVAAIVPPDTSSADQELGTPPGVVTATVPTELIAFDGQPQYAPLVSDQLLYATNTESDVIREIPTQHIYVLLAGRWFRSLSMSGPWEFVRGDDLPASFAQVAPDSPKGHILASVSGTDQADDAIADSEIPQTSAISRDDHHFSVNYDGAPQFESIEGSSLQYAINTDAEVIFADGRYYACDQGVWYIADSPNGPWSVSETRPVGLDDVPPSCPVYNARYVYIYDATPTVIYMGYLPGYLGCYPHYGAIVYGTGYYYRPWRGHLYYYPRPCTWGYYPRYNPWLSGWSFGFSYGDGFLRVGTRWRSVPVAARPPVRPLWFGPGGYHRPLMSTEAVLVRTRRQALGRGKLSDRAPMNLYNRTDNVVRVDRTAARMPAHMATGAPIVASKIPNNVFAGRDGKVYRRETGGAWKVNSGSTWQTTHLPTSQTQIDRLAHSAAPGTSIKPVAQRMPAGPPNGSSAPRTPYQPPAGRSMPPPVASRQPPVAPAMRLVPGNLEREFHARERANPVAPVVHPAQPAPAGRSLRETLQHANQPEHKPKAAGHDKP